MLENEGVSIIHEVASDGPSELMADTINALDDEEYAQYMRYHIYCCEKKEMLGMRLLVLHNLSFYNRLMEQIRSAIEEHRYSEFKKNFLEDMAYPQG